MGFVLMVVNIATLPELKELNSLLQSRYTLICEMLVEIDHIARRLKKPVAFYIGKLQDALALDPLTAYSTVTNTFLYKASLRSLNPPHKEYKC